MSKESKSSYENLFTESKWFTLYNRSSRCSNVLNFEVRKN